MTPLILTAIVLLGADDAADKGDSKILGTWVVSAAVLNGKDNPAIVGHVVTFKGTRFTIQEKDDLVYEGSIRLGTGKPATIDFTHTAGKAKGKTWKGIWQVKGDTLQICDNAPDTEKDRPTSFAAKADSGYALVTLKRKKD